MKLAKNSQPLLTDDGELAQPEPLLISSNQVPSIDTIELPVTQGTVNKMVYIVSPVFIAVFAFLYFAFLIMYPAWALTSLIIIAIVSFLYHRKFPAHIKSKRTSQDNEFMNMISQVIEHFHQQQPTRGG